MSKKQIGNYIECILVLDQIFFLTLFGLWVFFKGLSKVSLRLGLYSCPNHLQCFMHLCKTQLKLSLSCQIEAKSNIFVLNFLKLHRSIFECAHIESAKIPTFPSKDDFLRYWFNSSQMLTLGKLCLTPSLLSFFQQTLENEFMHMNHNTRSNQETIQKKEIGICVHTYLWQFDVFVFKKFRQYETICTIMYKVKYE